MNKGFTVPAIMTRCSSLVDGGMNVGFHTKDIFSEEKLEIIKSHNKHGWLLFKENEIAEEEIPQQEADYEVKTPSQRLRSVIYVYWKQLGSKGDPELFYREAMERFINHVKNKLE